jgi:hypothetical protein
MKGSEVRGGGERAPPESNQAERHRPWRQLQPREPLSEMLTHAQRVEGAREKSTPAEHRNERIGEP